MYLSPQRLCDLPWLGGTRWKPQGSRPSLVGGKTAMSRQKCLGWALVWVTSRRARQTTALYKGNYTRRIHTQLKSSQNASFSVGSQQHRWLVPADQLHRQWCPYPSSNLQSASSEHSPPNALKAFKSQLLYIFTLFSLSFTFHLPSSS